MGNRFYTTPVMERFLAKVDASGDCWEWTAATANGYGNFWVGGNRWMRAHLYLWSELVGPVPDGLELDHLCRNRICVNPDHLEPVTRQENLLRSPLTRTSINAAKTLCPKGHEYTKLRSGPRIGQRYCRICRREQANARYRRGISS